jgi:hypothetical protein
MGEGERRFAAPLFLSSTDEAGFVDGLDDPTTAKVLGERYAAEIHPCLTRQVFL